jgi:exodeoxyribonuclease V gamma subunit
MSTVYTSNRLEVLCDTLASNLNNSNGNVFSKQIIVTQSAGMNAWLKIGLTQRNGVLAQVDFLNPDGLFGCIYRLLYNESLKNNSDNIKYQLYQLLEQEQFISQFPEVSKYYEKNPKRRFDLATKIANLFDQYQVYRPEMLQSWKAGINNEYNTASHWQKWLWEALGIESKFEILERMKTDMIQKQDEFRRELPSVSLFGISMYTNFHLDFLQSLSQCTDLRFYLSLPVQNEISDISSQNELYESFGSKARELAKQFSEGTFEKISLESNIYDLTKTDLFYLQEAISENKLDKHIFQNDDSIQINSCYTPVREAECLYNYLLDAFEKDESLLPRDILVLTTDINKYAPFIKAVFQNAPLPVPFQVSGAATNTGDTIVATIELLLNMTEEDLTAEKVVSLVEQNRIKRRYQVNDTEHIRSIVRKANIRFGMENKKEDDSKYVSWRYGFEKIILGYAMLSDDENEEYEDFIPFRDAEAGGSYDLFRLKKFTDDLFNLIQSVQINRTPAAWKQFLLEEVLDKMIYCDDFDKKDGAEVSSIYNALSYIDILVWDEVNVIPFTIFLSELRTKLFNVSVEQKLNTGRVTISSAIPVRGLPYKIICFIGLDNGVFPRQDRFAGFDLLGETYIEGDRSKKETDKHLFLDTLLAVRQRLYFSYTGQSVKDNTEVPPSIVLDTLMDHSGIRAVKHPLHGFSSSYQSDDNRLYTYFYGALKPELETKEETDKNTDKDISEISVYSFVKFFEHPINWYFNNVLDIKFDDVYDTLPENELFELNHLEKWIVKNDLLHLPDDDDELNKYIQNQMKGGKLPLKNLGRLIVGELLGKILEIKTSFQTEINSNKERNAIVDIVVKGMRIKGVIKGIYGRKYIAYEFSENKKHRVAAYIHTLLLCTACEIDEVVFLDVNGIGSNIIVYTREEAMQKLEELMGYVVEGKKAPLKFTISATIPPSQKKPVSIESVLKAFRDEAESNERSPYPPNIYMQSLFNEGYFDNFNKEDLEYLLTIDSLINH